MKKTKSPPLRQLPDRSNYAIASLVFAAFSLFAATQMRVLLAIILGLSAMVYAYIARDSRRKRLAQAGALLGLFGLVAGLLAAGII